MKTFHGKSMTLGGGGRFAKGVSDLEAKGMSSKSASAIMAAAGRKKYGATKMQSMATHAKATAHPQTHGNMTRAELTQGHKKGKV